MSKKERFRPKLRFVKRIVIELPPPYAAENNLCTEKLMEQKLIQLIFLVP